MPAVFLDDLDKYWETGGYDYNAIGSGLVRFDLDPSLQIPYLWWTPKSRHGSPTDTHFIPLNQWWSNIPGLASEENLPYLEQIDFFKFIPKDLQHISDQFYYLVVPHVEESRFSLPEIQQVAQDNIFKELDLSSHNPAASSHNTFKTLFSPDHRVYRRDIEPANLDIWDLINFLKESEELCHESMPGTNNENCSTGSGNTGSETVSGETVSETGSGNTGSETVSDETVSETVGGETDSETVSDETVSETVGGETVSETVGGETVSETVSDETDSETVSGETVSETVGGETDSETVSDETVSETVGGETDSETVSDKTVSETVSDETVSETVGGETDSETVSDETVSETVSGETDSVTANPIDPVSPQQVPEYSSILTIAIFGVVLCSRLFKRKSV